MVKIMKPFYLRLALIATVQELKMKPVKEVVQVECPKVIMIGGLSLKSRHSCRLVSLRTGNVSIAKHQGRTNNFMNKVVCKRYGTVGEKLETCHGEHRCYRFVKINHYQPKTSKRSLVSVSRFIVFWWLKKANLNFEKFCTAEFSPWLTALANYK